MPCNRNYLENIKSQPVLQERISATVDFKIDNIFIVKNVDNIDIVVDRYRETVY